MSDDLTIQPPPYPDDDTQEWAFPDARQPAAAHTAATAAALAAAPRPLRRHLYALPVLLAATFLYTYKLTLNGYANTFYSAAVRSMLRSAHNFFFISFDPGGLISVDKPPLGLWLQGASAGLFGLTPLSVLLPEAIAGLVAIVALYVIVERRFGLLAGIAAAATLAVFPSFAAVARTNNVDAPLIALMVLACGAGLRAIDSGRLRTLILAAVLVGLAFNTKALAAVLVVPGIALGYLVCAPGPPLRRVGHLLAAGVVMVVLSLAWMLIVDAVPASHRPFVGGSTNNSELNLTFAYNGFGRVGGQSLGPGTTPNLFVDPNVRIPGPVHHHHASTHRSTAASRRAARRAHRAHHAAGRQRTNTHHTTTHRAARHTQHSPSKRLHVRALAPPSVGVIPTAAAGATPAIHHEFHTHVIPYGRPAGPLRLFKFGINDQAAWMLPFALLGLIALALAMPRRRDPRLAALFVLGGFFVVEAVVLSFSKGIVHPYYVSALGPGTAAMVGVGVAAIAARPQRFWLALLAVPAILATTLVQVALLRHHDYLLAWTYVLAVVAVVGLAVMLIRPRWASAALATVLVALLVAPTAYTTTLWRRPVQATFPAAGPTAAGGYGGVDQSPDALSVDYDLISYLVSHDPAQRFPLLTESSVTAAPLILLGFDAAAMGGYGGVDPALDGPGLGRLVAAGEARYVYIGGGYDYLGGNAASKAAERVCPIVSRPTWSGPDAPLANQLFLLDCHGQAAALERQPAGPA